MSGLCRTGDPLGNRPGNLQSHFSWPTFSVSDTPWVARPSKLHLPFPWLASSLKDSIWGVSPAKPHHLYHMGLWPLFYHWPPQGLPGRVNCVPSSTSSTPGPNSTGKLHPLFHDGITRPGQALGFRPQMLSLPFSGLTKEGLFKEGSGNLGQGC